MKTITLKFASGRSTISFLSLYLYICMLISYCLATDTCHSGASNSAHKYLATKTPYRLIMNRDDSPMEFEGCESQRIWMIIRHGTRNPGSKMIRKMRERLPTIKEEILYHHNEKKGKLCKDDFNKLASWLPLVEEVNEKYLTFEGEDEMIELAERFQKRFPTLFPELYKNSTYKFRYTATQRTGASARHFATGLFGRKYSKYVWFPEALHRDPILRFYKLCSRWRAEIDKNPDSYIERKRFERGPHMKATIKDISRRLGLNKSLSIDDVDIIYNTCSFETAWYKFKPSPWCSAFTDDNLKVLEYAEDLEYYWIDGYGYELTYRQACPAFRDMVQYLKMTSETGQERPPSAVAYFTHSGTLLKMISHLGLYQDVDELRHDNFNTTATTRQWRVGKLDSFATNLAFVLYQCGEEKKILTLHQERPVNLPGCPPNELCPLDALTAEFADSISRCDFDEMCSMPVAPAA